VAGLATPRVTPGQPSSAGVAVNRVVENATTRIEVVPVVVNGAGSVIPVAMPKRRGAGGRTVVEAAREPL